MCLDQGDLRTGLENSRELASFTALAMLCLVFYFLTAFLILTSRAGSVSYSSWHHSVLYAIGHMTGAQAALTLNYFGSFGLEKQMCHLSFH